MMIVATIVVILILILISFHFYVRYRQHNHVIITIHQTRHIAPATSVIRGLDVVAISSLPTFINGVGSQTNDCSDECVVCLSAAEEGEVMRMLPECKHVFHVECIDMWLHSHSTCPICRTRAKPTTKYDELLVAPSLLESVSHGVGSESSEVSGTGNGSRRWLSTIDDGVVDLERQ